MKNLISAVKKIAFVMATFGIVGLAHAGLIGNNIQYNLTYPGTTGAIYGSQSGIISNGTVFGPIYAGIYSTATFTDTTISFTDTPSYIPNVFYSIIGSGLDITGVSAFGIDAARVSFDADHIYINVGGYPADFSVALEFGQDVPEPGSVLLLSLGLAGLAFARRNKAAAKA